MKKVFLKSVLWLAAAIVVLGLDSCNITEPDEPQYRIGDSVYFSGYVWDIKSTAPGELQGPGPNFFSNRADDVYVDSKGRLHLKIAQQNSNWYATEVVGRDALGFGTYTWTVSGDLKNIPRNVVLGLFSWDTETFQTDGNSEVDVEFSYWGNDTLESSLLYSVQPVNFTEFYPERTHEAELENPNDLIGRTTHTFTWTPEIITWESYKGSAENLGEKIADWSFDNTNRLRRKKENGIQSDPFVIPEPGDNTNARINLWIATWLGAAPDDGMEQEVIIESFDYKPL